MLRRLLILGAASAVVAGLVATWVWRDLERSLERPVSVVEDPTYVIISPGTSLRQIALDLQRRGLIEHPRYLIWHARLDGVAHAVKAGEYRVEAGVTLRELLRRFVAGEVALHALTLVEGWTFVQVRRAVAEHEALAHTVAGLDAAEVMSRIGRPDVNPEGRFFPDTYHFPRDTTDVAFLRRAFDAMSAYLERAWATRAPDLPLRTPDEALTLASIVEKETGAADERARIAGVFVRRLRRGMRLETDPTVIYGMGDAFDGNLRRRDLLRDTPYNTYVHKGLPPTPIALPGAAALDAVLHPEEGDALFFVATGDGRHHFSATYAEHRRAVSRYQLGTVATPPATVASDDGEPDG